MLFILFLSVFVVVFIDLCLKKKIFLCLVLACLLWRAFSCMAWHHKDQDLGTDGPLRAPSSCVQLFSLDDALSFPQTSLCSKDSLATWDMPKPSTEVWKQSYQQLWKPWFFLLGMEWFSVFAHPDERITKVLQGNVEPPFQGKRSPAWLYDAHSSSLERPLQRTHAKQKKGKPRALLALSSTSCQQKCGRHALILQKAGKGYGGKGKKASRKAFVPQKTKEQPICSCKVGRVEQKKGQKKAPACQKRSIKQSQRTTKKKAISVV